jgi:hypothetical protein
MARNIQTISIGKIINDALKLYQSQYTVSPVIVPQDTKYPFVVYKKTGLEAGTHTSMDLLPVPEKVFVEVSVVSDIYGQTIQISEQIRNTLTGITNQESYDLRVENSYMTNCIEDYIEGAYVQVMTFCFVCNHVLSKQDKLI